MANGNSSKLWTILGFIITATIVVSGVIYGYASLGKDVEGNTKEISNVKDGLKTYVWPEVEASKKHRNQDELSQKYLEERFNKLEHNLDAFTSEQRQVNTRILQKLDHR